MALQVRSKSFRYRIPCELKSLGTLICLIFYKTIYLPEKRRFSRYIVTKLV